MDVELITKDTENLLVSSLRGAITEVNKGGDPNVELAKQAVDNGLGPELACRLVEAFNTSKTLNKLRNTEGEKRAETFALADRDTVVATLYDAGSVEKTAAVVVPYNNPRRASFNTRPEAHNEKAAAAGKLSLNTEYTKKAVYGIDGNVVIAGRSFLNSIKNARDDYRMHIKRAKEDVAKSLYDFVAAFKRADRSQLSPLKDVEERLSYHFGPVAKMAMDLAWDQLSEKQQSIEKRAEEVPASHVYPLNDPIYKLGEQLINDLKDAGDLQAEFLKFDKKASLVETHFKQQVDLLAGKVASHGVKTESVLTEEQQVSPILSKSAYNPHEEAANNPKAPAAQAPAAPKNTGLNLDSVLNIPDAKPVQVRSVFPAEHEGRLRAIKTKLMLNDFLSNDPVISGYPVEDVTGAYNRLAEMVPALSTQPIAMRGLLANMLQREGGLEAMEVKNLLDTEESKRKLRVLGE